MKNPVKKQMNKRICALLCLCLALGPAAALAADAAPLVLMTLTKDSLGQLSPALMPPLTDDLGNRYNLNLDGENAGRSVFTLQRIPCPKGKAPASISFLYEAEGQKGSVSYSLNQAALRQVFLYRISIEGLKVTRALLNSQISESQHFVVEQVPQADAQGITLLAPAGPTAHLILFDGDTLLFNIVLTGSDYPIDPTRVAESMPKNLETGQPQSVKITLLDVYDFKKGKSAVETNPALAQTAAIASAQEAPQLTLYELMVYPWADCTLYSDPEMTAKCPPLQGGNSYLASEVAGFDQVVAVLQDRDGQQQILGYLPKGVEDIVYNVR